MDLFMSATCCFCLCWNKRKRDFYHRTEAMALCEGYLLAFPTVIKSLRRGGPASYFPLKSSEGESARRYTRTSGSVRDMWDRFYLTSIFCALLNKEERVEVVFGFWIQLERPVLTLTGVLKLCSQVMCAQDVQAVCGFPPISGFEHSNAVPPRGTLLVSGSLHTVTQTEQTPAPVPRLVLINYQQRLYPAAAGGKQCIKRNGRECGMPFFHHQGSGLWHQGNKGSPTWYEILRAGRCISSVVWPLFMFLFNLNVHYLSDMFNYRWCCLAWWCWWFTFVCRDPPRFALFNMRKQQVTSF